MADGFILGLVIIGVASVLWVCLNNHKKGLVRKSDIEHTRTCQTVCKGAMGLGALIIFLNSFAIIETGKAGVVRTLGVVQEKPLSTGLNLVQPWVTVTRKEVRGSQLDLIGDSALAVITSNGTRFTMDVSIPMRLNLEAVSLVESKIQGGDWRGETTSIARSILRNNVSKYETFSGFNIRRTTPVDGVEYSEEMAEQIETSANSVFCETYGICSVPVVLIGDVLIRKVTPPPSVAAESESRDAAELAKATEQALNELEKIRANRRTEEGNGYGNLFSFLPSGQTINAESAADFLRASADKTRADAEAYMQRQLADSIAGAIKDGVPVPNLFVTTGSSGNSPTPVYSVSP